MAVTKAVKHSEILPEEEQPLFLQNANSHQATKRKCCKCLRYRLLNISEKGAIFMIILNMFFGIALLSCFLSATLRDGPLDLQLILLLIPTCLVVLLFPIFALLGDCYFGRYKMLQASIHFLLFSIVIMALNTIIMITSICYVTLVLLALSAACYIGSIIPFTIDQLIGASGEELSFTIYWIIWTFAACAVTQSLFVCYLPTTYQLQQAILFGLASVSFIVVFTMMHCCSHVLMKKPQISNPIKLVAGVLTYARKNKVPERRSAFTYWEEECPSRIDLGKDKYGGPFTTEEVEDVKTLLKLIPLVTIITVVVGSGTTMKVDDSSKDGNINDLLSWIKFLLHLLIISYLPIYQFLVYPFLYNHIPSMLRRIGCGIFLIAISHALHLVIQTYAAEQSEDEEKGSAFDHFANESEKISVSIWLMLAINFVNWLGLMITASTTLEFVNAQSPCQLRGFVTSMFLELWIIFGTPGLILRFSKSDHYYTYVGLSVVMLGMFFLFVFVSKWYKLRKRDDVIPYHMFAENEFESNYREENEYLKNHGWTL